MIAVTFALPVESSGLLARLSGKTRLTRSGITTIRGQLGNKTLEVLDTGVGQSACQERIESFLKDQHFTCLISSGFAGATSDSLSAGDLIVADNFSEAQLASMAERILQRREIRRATLFTSAKMIE